MRRVCGLLLLSIVVAAASFADSWDVPTESERVKRQVLFSSAVLFKFLIVYR